MTGVKLSKKSKGISKEDLIIYNKINNDRIKLLKSYHHIFIDISPTGTGKTTFAREFALSNYKNSIIFMDNHDIIYEFDRSAWLEYMTDKTGKRPKPPITNILFGKTYKLNDAEKAELESLFDLDIKGDYLCNLGGIKKHKDLFQAIKSGNIPNGVCKKDGSCPLSKTCNWIEHKKNNFSKAYKYAYSSSWKNQNLQWLLVKQYADTYTTERIFKLFKNKTATIIDENFQQMLYDQIEFKPNQIKNYVRLINKCILLDDSLKDVWNGTKRTKTRKDMNGLLNLINSLNIETKPKSEKYEKTLKIIIKQIINIVNIYNIDDLDIWNNKVKNLTLKYSYLSPFKNQTNKLIDILRESKSLDEDEIKKRIFFSVKEQSFNFIIDKRDLILNIFNNSIKVLITSAILKPEILNSYFPTLIEGKDYVFFNDKRIKPAFKNVYCYTSGEYPKYVLLKRQKIHIGITDSFYDPYSTNIEFKITKRDKVDWSFTKEYFKLAKVVQQLFVRHRKQKILLVAYKEFFKTSIKHLEKYILPNLLKNVIEKFEIYLSTAYWYNLAGKNVYHENMVGVLFGTPGKPKEYINAMKKIFGHTEEITNYLNTEAELLQAIGRLRDNENPNKKILYQLSKYKIDYYKKYYKDFNHVWEIEYKGLLDWLKKKGDSTTDEIMEYYFKLKKTKSNYDKVENILNELFKDRFIKRYFESDTRKKDIAYWYIY